jgi:hypothetical protein
MLARVVVTESDVMRLELISDVYRRGVEVKSAARVNELLG